MRFLSRFGPRTMQLPRRRRPIRLERLEDRTVPTVSILNSGGYGGLSFNQSSGGYVPPDTSGAAGPTGYVETVNQSIEVFPNKATSSGGIRTSLSSFFFTTGGLTRADSGSGLSDPVVAYDELIGRFIVGDQDVNFSSHVSAFDVAVSRTSSPTTLSASDWAFYKIVTTESGYDADYAGNFGYNGDAFVFTLNMFGVSGGGHVQVVSVKSSDLANAVASPLVAKNDLNDFSVRPTAMHGSASGDPMWLVTEHGDGRSIDVIKMTSVLSNSATFTYTNLSVTTYSGVVTPKNPNGTVITNNIDSRIQKAAEANGTLVAAHAVGVSTRQDAIQWYAINVAGATPTLAQQGRVASGNNTYSVFPGIDINSSGQIGMSYMKSGSDTSTDYMSMWVTGRVPADAVGTMETPVQVPAGTGLANYDDFTSGGRAGDLSGINVDPVDGTFWAANEFANTLATANWGTAIANFSPSSPANSADLAVTVTGPSSVMPGSDAMYIITLTNNGSSPALNVVLTDTLPTGAIYVSFNQTGGSDSFSIGQSGGTATATGTAAIAAGSTDTFTLLVTADAGLQPGANFSDTASVSSSTADPNSSNNTATATGSIVGAPADIAVTNTGQLNAAEGDTIVFTITVTNTDGANPATGVVLTDTLDANLRYVSATTTQGTFSQSNGVVTFTLGEMAPNADVTVTVTAQALEDGIVTNSAAATATSGDPDTGNNSATASTAVSEPAIVVSGPITTTTNNLSNVTVATFTHANGVEPTSAFSAVINWGDGITSAGTITQSGTTYNVIGSHKYKGGHNHTISTTVTEIGNAAELLMVKIGDEEPDLPDQAHNWNGIVHQSMNGQTNQVTHLVSDFLSGAASMHDVASSLTALFARARAENQTPHLSGLYVMLRMEATSNPWALDVLLLLDNLWADFLS